MGGEEAAVLADPRYILKFTLGTICCKLHGSPEEKPQSHVLVTEAQYSTPTDYGAKACFGFQFWSVVSWL